MFRARAEFVVPLGQPGGCVLWAFGWWLLNSGALHNSGARALCFRGISLPFPPSSPTLGFMELSGVVTGDWTGLGGVGSMESEAQESRAGRVDPRQHLGLEETDGSSFLLQNFPSTPPLGYGESGGIQRPKSMFSGLLLGVEEGGCGGPAISALFLLGLHCGGPSRSTVLLRWPASSVWGKCQGEEGAEGADRGNTSHFIATEAKSQRW